MSIEQSGLNDKVIAKNVLVEITDNHPLIKLSNALFWDELAGLALPDLQATTQKKKWWLGRATASPYSFEYLFSATIIPFDRSSNGICHQR